MINKSILKIIFFLSLITGGIIGLLPLIPALTWIAFLIIMFFAAPFILIYLKKSDIIQETKMEQSLIISAISGASAYIGFSVVYFPCAFILYLIFKIQSFLWIKVIFNNFGFLIPMIIFSALLCALLNTFSGFLTEYFYQYIKSRK